jgi:RNA polymerase sigma-54 factor
VKQSFRQKQKLSLNLTLNLQKQIELLSLSGFEIRSDLDNLISEFLKESDNKKLVYFKDEVLTDRFRNVINPDLKNDFFELLIDQEKSLREKLMEQLVVSPLKEYESLIGEVIIDSILDNGRLDPELEYRDIKRIVKEDFNLNIKDTKIEFILKLIQNFDPPGCGYRSIEESLKIQVNNLVQDKEEQEKIMRSLTSLVNQKIRKEDLSPEIRIQIDKLSLNLGFNFGKTKDLYVRPDLIAFYQRNIWQVSLNDDFMNKNLIEVIKNEIDSSTNGKVIEAKSFLRGLERRQQILILVGQCILTKQSDYLNEASDRKPITNKEIAKALKISESTVSRILKNKYIQLPNKLIPLKELLQKKVNKNLEGKDVTPKELKNYITLLISEENSNQPLSDESLKTLLSNNHLVKVARRTVTKYREEAGIGSTRVRKIN